MKCLHFIVVLQYRISLELYITVVEDNISTEGDHLTTTNADFQNKTNLPELLKGILLYEIKWKYSGNIYKA